MAAKLVGLRGSLTGQTVTLAPDTSIGRETGNTIVLDDQTVGRKHARIQLANGQWTLHDLGSSNGTFVNDVRVATTALKPGDAITLGGQLLRFEADRDVAAVAPPPRIEVGRRESAGPMPFTTGIENPGLFRGGAMGRDLGCLDVNLEGCVRWLIIALIAIAVLALLALIASGLLGGLGALGGAGSGSGGGAGAQSGTGAGGGSQQSQGAGGGGQEGETRQEEPIRIIEVKVDYAVRPGHSGAVPVILVTWQNVGEQPIREIRARIFGYGDKGEAVGEIPAAWIYRGDPVAPGGQHRDTIQSGGVVAVPGEGNKLTRAPRTARVTVQDAR